MRESAVTRVKEGTIRTWKEVNFSMRMHYGGAVVTAVLATYSALMSGSI